MPTFANNGSPGNSTWRAPAFLSEHMQALREFSHDPAFDVDGMPPNFGQYPVPHLLTYQALHGTYSRVYRPSDEALKHSLENSRYMRNDPGVMECIEARQRSVALLDWHLEPDDENSPEQVELAAELTKILESIRRFTEYRHVLQHAIWYGRYGIQNRYGWRRIGERMRLMPAPKRENPGWLPINGDKLVFRYDDGQVGTDMTPDQLGIRVGHRHHKGDRINDRWTVEPTGRGLAYFLTDWERRVFCVHKHMIEDGAYEDPQGGGQIHGVGIRSRIYWDWFQKQESLAFLMEYLERSAGGIEIWTYPSGDQSALTRAKEAAKERISNQRNIVFFPKPLGDDGNMFDVQVIEPGMAGIESLKDILTTYFGHRIKRYILGQVLSSEAEATGLGSGVAELHFNTFLQIVRYDATNLEETLTHELVEPLKDWNFPSARHIPIRFKIETESPDVEKRLEAYRQAWEMGASLREQDVMDMIGASMPDEDDQTLKNPQMDPAAQDPMGGMGMDPMGGGGDPLGMMGGGDPTSVPVAPPSPDEIADQAISNLWGEDAKGGEITYVNEDGKWEGREVPAFDTGDRSKENAIDRFERQRSFWDEGEHPRDADGKFSSGGDDDDYGFKGLTSWKVNRKALDILTSKTPDDQGRMAGLSHDAATALLRDIDRDNLPLDDYRSQVSALLDKQLRSRSLFSRSRGGAAKQADPFGRSSARLAYLESRTLSELGAIARHSRDQAVCGSREVRKTARWILRAIEKYRRQAVDSAGTSLNQVPALLKKLVGAGGFVRGGVNFDVGGGKYDKATQLLKRAGVINLVYDPFNREADHNQSVLAAVKKRKADTATLANVLNVIPEPENQLQALQVAKVGLKPGGILYIDVHEGDGSGRPAKTSRGFQQNRKLKDYVPLVQQVFGTVTVKNGMILACDRPDAQYSRVRAAIERYDRQMTLFKEEDHPRDADGQFIKKGTGGGTKKKRVVDDAGSTHPRKPSGSKIGPVPRGVRSLFDDSDGERDRDDDHHDRPGDGPGPGPKPGPAGPAPGSRRRPERDHSAGNWRYRDREFVGGGLKTKFKRNVEAIKTLRQIEAEGRQAATIDEQKVLAEFTGWGQFPQLFEPANYEWEKERAQLEALLSEDEYAAAKKSASDLSRKRSYSQARRATLNSHFTNPVVVDAHWKIAQKLGFKGGRYLDPSVGSGYYLGLMPEELAKRTAVTGVELDHTTSQIAKLLYPSANIKHQGFEEFAAPDNFYDLVGSNVPFGTTRLFEKRYNRFNAPIHDHFFLKSLDKVRPGGLVMHVTSAGTLDKTRDKVRTELAKHADLVAAIRLPGSTHKDAANTEVVTDLIVLRKHTAAGPAPEATPSEVTSQVKEPGFTGVLTDSLGRVYHFVNGKRVPSNWWTETTTVPDPAGGKDIPISQYFADNPDQILGTVDRTGTMYSGNQMNVTPTEDLDDALEKVIQRIPEGIYQADVAPAERFEADAQLAPDELKDGNLVVQDGIVMQRSEGALRKRDDLDPEMVAAVVAVREPLREVFQRDLEGENSEDARSRLNEAYDAFVDQYGPLHSPANLKALHDDPDLPLLLSLETWDKKSKTASKADIFDRVTIRPRKPVDSAETVPEALGITLNQNGHLDVDNMAQLLGRPREDIEDELRESGLAFDDPELGWVPRSEYLSGNVRKKLSLAEEAAKVDPRYQVNVDALKDSQPEDIDYEDISAKLGAPWIPGEDIDAFMAHLANGSPEDFNLRYSPELGQWLFDMRRGGRSYIVNSAAAMNWAAPTLSFQATMEAALNNKQPKVYNDVGGGKKELDVETTNEIRDKLQEIRDEFSGWLWDDAERRERLHRFYNDNYNNIIPTEYDGSHLDYPGMRPDWQMRPMQSNAVWQIISRGKGLLAHEVGTGKTATMVAAAMELRRLGLSKKPAIIGKKANIEQLAREARELYPGAKILNVSKQMTASQRKETVSQIATGDYDMVFLTHDNLDALPMDPEVEARFIQDELADLESALAMAQTRDEGRKSSQVKALEKRKANLERQIKMALSSKKDDAVTFEQTGIDYLFVDEAHRYKNLSVNTTLQVLGVPKKGSQRATAMLMKSRWLQEQNGGRGVVFATGTPISNSLVEAYTLQRFLQPEQLRERGIETFDAWVSTFGELRTELEPVLTGGYDTRTRLSRFNNVPELMQILRQDMDVQRAEEQLTPDGKPLLQRPDRTDHMVMSPMTDDVKQMLSEIKSAAQAAKNRQPQKGEQNYISIQSRGRAGSVDSRLWDANAEDHPDSKVNKMVKNVLQRYHDPQQAGQTQLIFSDVGVNPSSETGYHLYKDVVDKLVAGGIPRGEIVDFSTLTEAKKEASAAALKAGKKRIGIGSTEKLGTGTNVQTHLGALHHIDIPYVPAYLEQRNGRAHRHGNRNKQVDIYHYVTDGNAMDELSWGIVGRKSSFIAQAMKNPKSVARSMAEEDAEHLTPQQLMAAASGDIRILERVNLEHDLKGLRRAALTHKRNQDSLKARIRNEHSNVEASEARAKKHQQDADHLDEHKTFSMSLTGSSTTDSRQQAEQSLERVAKEIDSQLDSMSRWQRASWKPEHVGTYRGMDLYRSGAGGWILEGPSGERYNTGDSLKSIENVASRTRSKAAKELEQAERSRSDIAHMEAQIGKPFARQQLLEETEGRLKALEKELADDQDEDTPELAEVAKNAMRGALDRYFRSIGVSRYRWVTIGADKAAPEGRKGGTPVDLDESGNVTKGPDHLEGHHVGDLPRKPGGRGKRVQIELKEFNNRWYALADLPGGKKVSRSAESREQALQRATEDVQSAGHRVEDGSWELQQESATPQFGNTKGRQGQFFDPSGPRDKAPSPAHALQLPHASSPLESLQAGQYSQVTGNTVMHVEDLQADPERFQYKISGIGKEGVSETLKEVASWNPYSAGMLMAWMDPADGKAYVINGHHRAELAQRAIGKPLARLPIAGAGQLSQFDDGTGHYNGALAVQFIDAENAQAARALGAMTNITEGNGTALDAAKFMRDSGLAVDDMKEAGISLKGSVARDGSKLAGLSDAVFNRVATGRWDEKRGVAIADNLSDPEKQVELVHAIDKAEDRMTRELRDHEVAEMATEMDMTPVGVTSGGASLFGDEEMARTLLAERGIIKSAIRKQLGGELGTFKDASSSLRAGRLAEAGNQLDVEANKQKAQELAEAKYDFETRMNAKGDPIAAAISQAAEELFNAPGQQKQIVERTHQRIRDILAAKPAGTTPAGGEAAEAGGDRGAGDESASRFARHIERVAKKYRLSDSEIGRLVREMGRVS